MVCKVILQSNFCAHSSLLEANMTIRQPLNEDEQAALDGMGAWDDMVVFDEESGDFQLNTTSPGRFLRYLDALAWAHVDNHMREIGMRLTYPDPASGYPVRVECLLWRASG